MKTLLTISFSIWFLFSGIAQSTIGITGITDNSYNSYSALKTTLKTHPNALLVIENQYPNVSEKRDITYATIGERPLKLDIFYPKEKNTCEHPAILIIHGGGWRSGNRSQHIPMAQKLASMGYVTITAEYRLSTEALYPAAVQDLKAAVRWIRANASAYHVDSHKVACLGFSAGGQLATLVGNTNGVSLFEANEGIVGTSSDVQAIIDIDGIVAFIHPESGEGDDSKRTSAATYWFGFGKDENPSLWQQGSALSYTGKNTPPTLFINSSVDRMHAGRDDYRKILETNHIYSEVHTFNNSPHSFCLFSPWFDPTINYIDHFLKKVFRKHKDTLAFR
ncbi:MAG: alpha/beta hydrolase fold domain-containing protein [Flectobacillus sp.]|uniref:alpha/beta hydrolase fold domain-containing protein n=1 Tax=Flectobacillus sp. TaxID=50419 RepID=UPI003B9D0F4A